MTRVTTQLMTGHLNSFLLSCGRLSIAAKRDSNAVRPASIALFTWTWHKQTHPSLQLRQFCAPPGTRRRRLCARQGGREGPIDGTGARHCSSNPGKSSSGAKGRPIGQACERLAVVSSACENRAQTRPTVCRCRFFAPAGLFSSNQGSARARAAMCHSSFVLQTRSWARREAVGVPFRCAGPPRDDAPSQAEQCEWP